MTTKPHDRGAEATPRRRARQIDSHRIMISLAPPRPGLRAARRLVAGLGLSVAAWGAAAQGLNATGVSGGLSIPDARPLGDGTIALGLGNPREPQLVAQSSRSVSYVVGVGLAPGLDLVGRLAEYSTRRADGLLVGGVSDLSANLKFSIALWQGQEAPRLALGINDVGGGAQNFRAGYLVATQPWGRWRKTLGAGSSQARLGTGTHRPLDGVFGGIEHRLPSGALPGTLTLAAEHDGRQALAGVRWLSPALPALGGGRFSASAHRTAERATLPGSSSVGLFLTLPLGAEAPQAAREAPAQDSAQRPPPPPDAATDSAPARLGRLKEALVALGLEKVRVGRQGPDWVIEFQNRRFGHSELDALGIVLGLAAEAAPQAVRNLVAVSLKNGQAVQTLRVPAQAWRDFLRDGRTGVVREALQFERGPRSAAAGAIDWIGATPGPATWAQVRLAPELHHAVGTEVGAAEYALAGRLTLTVPLWTGAQLLASGRELLAVSDQATPTGALASLRPATGLRALAVHQTLWLGRHAVLGGAAGIFEHRAAGVEGEAVVFVPGREDVLRLRGRQLELRPEMPPGSNLQQWISYRWVAPFGGWAQDTWLEFGAQRHADGSHGPLLTLSRWWGDVGAHLSYRKGGERQYVGLELSFPLTPRAAPVTGPVHLSGASQWRTGLRTRLTDRRNPSNLIEPAAVRDLTTAWDLEANVLDFGRVGFRYTHREFFRMRAAFLTLAPAGS